MLLAVVSMYQWLWHRSKVPLAAVACAASAWRAAEQKKAVQAVNAMQCKYRQDRDYEDIQVTWGVKIAKFLVEMELFPHKANVG